MIQEILDKLVLFLCCTTLYLFSTESSFVIVPIILSILISCLFIYFDDVRIKAAGCLGFILLCLFLPAYIIFLPLILYNILNTRYQYLALGLFLVMYVHVFKYNKEQLSFTLLFSLISYLLKFKSDKSKNLQTEFYELRDNSVRISMLLEEKNRSLLKNQDNEVHLATLNERNRISKEIHDNIGHILSRSLLQVGALLTISQEGTVKEGLSDLKSSLSDGMDQIRSSIHQMYDESIDLYDQIDKLVKDFTFCAIHLDYDITSSPSAALKHSMIATVKEALTNVIRHSNATKVTVQLREHPAIYQLIIRDNGTLDESVKRKLTAAFENQNFTDGIGLRNITERMRSFRGNIHVSLERGFQLFISIPKNQQQ